MIPTDLIYTGAYFIIGIVFLSLYGAFHPESSNAKTISLLLFWPIIVVLNIVKFIKLSIKGLKEWFNNVL